MDKCIQEKAEVGTFSVENEKKEEKESKTVLNPKKIKVLVAVVMGNFFLGCCYATMAPIFPPKAEEKHASPTAYGFVFGIYELSIFLSSIAYGKLVPIFKPKFMMKAGMLLSGVCNIFFGFLDYAPAGPAFIGLAITIRFFDALGASAFLTSSYATVGSELSDIIGRAMSLTETAYALGLTAGPVIGGFFFQLGGLQLPFTVIGLILIAASVVNIFLFPKDDGDIPQQTISVLKLLKDIDFMIDIIGISSGFAVLVFNGASLEPHIRQFSLSPVTVGLMFLASGLTYAACSPLWGYFADKVPNAQYLTFLGSLICAICFSIVGPASFLNFKTVLWVVIVSQILLGLGEACLVVCSLTHGMKHIVERGFPDEVGTYSVVSGLMLSAACLGGFIGPSLGGFLIDKMTYIPTTTLVAAFCTMIAIICAGRLTHLFFKKRKRMQMKE